jgi:uncharacterized membrane protein YphA (DoxX/SURF4 family)
MNILLWVLQVALAWLCIGGGTFQIFKLDDLQQTVAAMRELPHALWALLGVFSCLAGLCLIVPGVLKKHTRWVPIAAAGMAVESLLVSAFYVAYGDREPLPYSVIMALLGAFIAYGRLKLAPLAAATPGREREPV